VFVKKNVLLCVGLILSGSSYQLLYGQSAPAAGDGIYSADQAHRGEEMYKKQCTACHGEALDGAGPYPPLAGDDFLTKYAGQPAVGLYDMIQKLMPATAPGTLTRKPPTCWRIFSASINFPPGKPICPTMRTASRSLPCRSRRPRLSPNWS
jgi:cytochrome c553